MSAGDARVYVDPAALFFLVYTSDEVLMACVVCVHAGLQLSRQIDRARGDRLSWQRCYLLHPRAGKSLCGTV